MQNNTLYSSSQEMCPFIPVNDKLHRLNTMWKEQLKSERDRVRQNLIAGNQAEDSGILSFDTIKNATVTVVGIETIHHEEFDRLSAIPPLVCVTTKFPSQQSIVDEFTLNREQRAAFMIITSHLDGDIRCRIGKFALRTKFINID